MRVSLAPSWRRVSSDEDIAARPAAPLLDASGARVIIGGEEGSDGLARPIVPSARTVFGPRGACLAGDALVVCDTGHHRLLIWNRAPETDADPADLVIGQADFTREGRNAKGDISAVTLNVPTGLAFEDGVLAVADAWNHRVLIWLHFPTRSNTPADVVLGQADFSEGLANRGANVPRADTLNWCYGVFIADGRLFVADTGNRRVLVWDKIPETNGAPADLVLGQRDPETRDENAGESPSAIGMRWPHGLALDGEKIFVTDAGNNRVMVWDRLPARNGRPCDFVLGQGDVLGVDHNRAAYYPGATALSMPYGAAIADRRLMVADTANSRLLGFDLDNLAMGSPATRLSGQRRFEDKGDNRWGPAKRDSVCWPYALSISGNTAVVADSGNSRVLLWEAAP